MRHEVSKRRGHNEAAQIDHAGPLADDGEHFIGHSLGQAALSENQTDHDGSENKKNRRIHEILERYLRLTNEKHGLGHTDSDAGHTDGQNLENPPGCGQGKNRQCSFAFLGQNKMVALRVDGIRPGRAIVDDKKQSDPQQKEEYPFPVERSFGLRLFAI
ncbi:MAG: hypothetical protein ACD_75C02244G0001 [uncultured bacterium]|nr:MAG: hypothetical protein ACD_75C02244G0001 [uncultured bacterium]